MAEVGQVAPPRFLVIQLSGQQRTDPSRPGAITALAAVLDSALQLRQAMRRPLFAR